MRQPGGLNGPSFRRAILAKYGSADKHGDTLKDYFLTINWTAKNWQKFIANILPI
jgi:hypothetical protein